MQLTLNQLAEGMPDSSPALRAKFLQPLNDAMSARCIDNPLRMSAFLATVAEESGHLVYVKELWGPTEAQKRYERDFEAAWPPNAVDQRNKKAFELGNPNQGDGKKNRGRGLIQVTGGHNYLEMGRMMGLDLVNHPELLELPENAALSAAIFWSKHGCNKYADDANFRQCTIIVNGWLTHWEKRLATFNLFRRILKC